MFYCCCCCCSCRKWTIRLKNLYRNNQRNSTCGHIEKDLEMKPFRPIILNELSGADMRRRHEAGAFLMERFPTGLPLGKFLFPDECFINRSSLSQNVIFWPKWNLITRFIWKTTHHTSWYGEVYLSLMLLAHISLTEMSTVSHILKRGKIMSYLSPPPDGSWKKWGYNSIVLQLISTWLCLNSLQKHSQDWTCFFIIPSSYVMTFTQSWLEHTW